MRGLRGLTTGTAFGALAIVALLASIGGASGSASAAADGYAAAVAADAPLAYWRLAESSGGSLVDSSGNGRAGSYLGSPVLGQAGVVAGNAAVGFNGSSQYAQLAFDAALNPAQFSVEAWAKLTGGAGTYRSVVTSRNSGFAGYTLYATAADTWQFWLGTGSAWLVVNGPAVALNQWTHLVATFDGATGRLYVNGVLAASAPVSAFSPNTLKPLRLAAGGTEGSAIYFFPGSLDEVAVYNGALSLARVQAHYNAATPNASAPGAPSGVTASALDGQASVWWAAPGDGGNVITGYEVSSYVGGVLQATKSVAATPTSTTVTGLANGTTYTFRVAAKNAVGTGPASADSTPVTPSAADGYAAAVAADAPLAYWRLAESSGGSLVDSSGNGRAGSYLGSPVLGQAGVVAGNAAVGFNGSSQYAQLAFDAALNPAQFSVEAWAKLTGGAGTYRSVVTSRNSGFAGYTLYATAADTWQFWLGTGSAWLVVNGPAVALNQWTHLVATFDGATGRLYVNGVLAASAPVSAFSPNTLKPLRLAAGGTEGSAIYFFPGSLDEVAVYNGALSLARVQAHYNAATPNASAPGAPSGVTASALDGQASVWWAAPGDGGNVITGYEVSSYVGGVLQATKSVAATPTSTTVTGLANGTTYTFRVAAKNAVGTGPASADSTPVTPSAADGYAAAVAADAPLAYWRLAESSGGSLVDSSGNGRAGSYLGSPVLGQAGVVAGNAAVGFNGSSQYAQLAFDAALNPAQFSVEAWAKLTGGAGTYRSVVTSRNSGFAGYTLYATAADTWQFWLGTGSAWLVVNGPAVALNQWTHLVATFDGATGRLYVNGVLAASAPVSAFSPNTLKPLRLAAGGTEGSAIYFFPGSLDEVAVYNGALSLARVQAHYNAATPNASAPGAPSGVTASALDGQASVWWAAPGDGGNVITGYEVSSYVGGVLQATKSVAATPTSTTVTGLANGTTYTFRVAAKNAVGTGPASADSTPVTPSAADGYAAAVAADAPLAYWRLAESSGGSLVDSSGNGRAGSYLGSPVLGQAGVVAGNAAVGFNGSSQYAQLAFDAALNPAQFSVEAWAKLTGGAGTYRSVVTSRNSGFAGYTLYATAADTWQFWLGTGSAWLVVNGPAVALNQWTHLVATFDGATGRLYVNGVLAASAPVSAFSPNTLKPLRLAAGGTEGSAIYFFPGSLDEVAVYNGALSLARVQAHYNAATPNASAPGAPSGVTATAGNGSVSLSWSAPGSDGGAAVTGYRITAYVGGVAQPPILTGSSTTSYTVTGLMNGTPYTFTVAAINSAGGGPDSAASNAVTPATTPAAPSNVTGTPGNGSVSLSWSAPGSDGGAAVTGYRITPYVGSSAQTSILTGSSTTSYTVTGLMNGTPYTFTVAAINSAGGGPDSAASNAVTPATTPAAPSNVTGTPGNGSVSLSWSAPGSDGGAAVTGYRITAYVGSSAQTSILTGSTATSYTVTGLTNGTGYTFRVAAGNSVGTGPDSAASNAVTPATTPAAPSNVTGTPGNGSVSLSWSAPGSDGGAAVTGYRITAYVGGVAQPPILTGSSTTSYTVTGLMNGTPYTFTVAAINSAGGGPDSAASAAVTPQALSNWLQFDGSSSHQGVNWNESTITASNVTSLHQHWQITLPGVADNAPVVATGVATPSGPQNLVVVVTKGGALVARNFNTGAAVWSITFGPGTCKVNRSGSACTMNSAPVIDPSLNYVYTYGLDGMIHKVALGTGVEVRDATWPVLATLKPWDEKSSGNLSSATAANGHTYLYSVMSAYYGDNGDYQGHLTAVDLATGVTHVFNTLCSSQSVHFAPAPSSPDCAQVQSGAWAKAGVTYSPATDLIYLATGNGDFSAAGGDWGDSVLALHPDGTGVNGGPVDSWTPSNQQSLNNNDLDLGSTLAAVVDAPAGSTVAHLGVQGGKEGNLMLLNLANLSGQGGPGHLGGELQTVAGPGNEVVTAPVVWTDASGAPWVIVSTGDSMAGYLVTLNASHQPQLTQRWKIPQPGPSPVIANGILYAARSGTLAAYNPTTGASLWSTSIGSIHWESPVVVNGTVLLADGAGHLTAWGR